MSGQKSMADEVIEFNRLVLNITQRPIDLLNESEFSISEKCLKEEIDEFIEAYKAGDIIGCVDALIDEIYFSLGVLYKMGLNAKSINDCFSHVHQKNMEKKLGINFRRGDGSAKDAVKPEDWVGPEIGIANILDNQ